MTVPPREGRVSTRSAGPAQGRRITKIIAGEHAVSADPEAAISTVLGSCVAACIRDPLAAVGGMNHFMLPSSDNGRWDHASVSLRYGNFAMERLINDLMKRGGRRERLEAKVFGAASLLGDQGAIGERNARFVREYLASEGVRVVAADLGGAQGRRLLYLPVSGAAYVALLGEHSERIAKVERQYGGRLPQRMATGTIELFD